MRNMTYSNVLGQGLIAIIQGTLLGIGFLIFGLSDPFFWGIVGIFLSMIPFFGTPFLFVPAGLIAISNGNIGAGIGIILYGYLLVTMIDNFIRMAIGRKIANTHPLITIIGVVIGFPLFGIMGILFGPLLLSLFIILARIYRSNLTEIIQLEEVRDGNSMDLLAERSISIAASSSRRMRSGKRVGPTRRSAIVTSCKGSFISRWRFIITRVGIWRVLKSR